MDHKVRLGVFYSHGNKTSLQTGLAKLWFIFIFKKWNQIKIRVIVVTSGRGVKDYFDVLLKKTCFKNVIAINLNRTWLSDIYVLHILSVSISVMVSMLASGAVSPGIDTQFGTFNGDHYFKDWDIYDTLWTKLVWSVVLFNA